MKKFALAVLPLLVMGCGTTSSITLDVPIAPTTPFSFKDQRSEEGRRSATEVAAFGTKVVFGDDSITPAPAELVKATLAKRLPQLLAGKEVVLTYFIAYSVAPVVSVDQNRVSAAAMSVPQASPAGAALAAPVILGIESVRSQKTVTVEVRAMVDGTEVTAFSADHFRGRVTEANVRSIVSGALERLVQAVQREVEAKSGAGSSLHAALAVAQEPPPSRSPGMVSVVPPGVPPPAGPPDTSLSQWPTPEELASGEFDHFPGMRGVAFRACGPAGGDAVRMVFRGERAEVRVGLARPLDQLAGLWQVQPAADPSGVWLAAVCDREHGQGSTKASDSNACREAVEGSITIQSVTEAEIEGVWSITFRDPVFMGGMSIQGPFRTKVSPEPGPPCSRR